MTTEYPEHEKLHKISDKSQAIGEFIEWLAQEKKLHLAEFAPTSREGLMWHAMCDIQELLAEFFEIDRDAIEREKRQMLEEIRRGT